MTVRIGIIGAGVMGADHARILSRAVAGVELAAVADADLSRAQEVVAECGAGRPCCDPMEIIRSDAVDAVLIASPDPTHKPLVLACLEVEKPVLCEKPLAQTAGDCLKIVEREARIGRRLIQVGFMRRFDPGYVEMRGAVETAAFGAPLMMHCVHRNETAPSYVRTDGLVTNSGVHEIDSARFVFGREVTRISVVLGRSSGLTEIRDPQLILMQLADGAIVSAEVFVNAQYGYDVRAELVCETGTLTLTPPHDTTVLHARHDGFRHPADWRARFAAAYEAELQAWVAAIGSGIPAGASTWDGYAAAAIAEAGVISRKSGEWAEVTLAERPALYG